MSKSPSQQQEEKKNNDDDDDLSSSGESEAPTVYATEPAALEARQQALKLFSENDFEAAMKIQEAVAAFFIAKHGQLAPECGLYYLDYGISLLATIQNENATAAALSANAGAENQDVELCHQHLESARLCLEKGVEQAEEDSSEEQAYTLRLAEVHDALSQLFLERDDEESAIEEATRTLNLRCNVLPATASDRRIVSSRYHLGLCYNRLQMYEQAEEHLTAAKDLCKDCQDIPSEMVGEIDQMIAEVQSMRASGGIKPLLDEIQTLYPDQEQRVELPEEEAPAAPPTPPKKKGKGASKANKQALPVLSSEVPKEISDSLRVGFGTAIPANNENSNSRSLFPRQQSLSGVPSNTSRGLHDTGKINTAVTIKRKPKEASQSQSQRSRPEVEEAEGPPEKRRKTQNGEQ